MSMTLMKDGMILELTNSSKYSINSDIISEKTFPDGIRVLCTVYAFTIANLSSNDSGNYTFSIVGQQFTIEVFILDASTESPTTPTGTTELPDQFLTSPNIPMNTTGIQGEQSCMQF